MGRVDYAAAEPLFADDVVGFGTRATVVSGRRALREQQWSGVWPNIRDFRFDLDGFVHGGDGLVSWAVVTWTSIGFHEDGRSYERPGRATLVFEWRDGATVCRHSHFSLAPGTPQRSYPPRAS